jgi:hypothetical protein
MSFMSVPALDRLLEPSEPESTSIRSWSTKAGKRTDMNMSPLFPSQPHAQPSPPQLRASPTIFSPSPYVLNFKRRVFDGNGTNGAIVEASCHNLGVAMQRTGSHVREATSSFRGESEVVFELKNKVVNNKIGLNEYGMLSEMEVQERLNLRGKSSEAHERFEVKNINKVEKLMTAAAIKTEEAKYNGMQRQESSRGLRSRNPLIRQPNIEFSSISLSNPEEFFDAPEEPFEGTISTFC